MSARKTESTPAEASTEKRRKKKKASDGTRETVESIAIAFILAFLFKTFQAEAYVIPTGSMAPTLYGRHKEVACERCGFEFALGASSELNQETGRLIGRLEAANCSNCGWMNDIRDAPVFNGDRIIVNKQVSSFSRFDVVVFKNPEQGHINYIKRLVGLPNETVRIRKGDLWVKLPGADVFTIQRKDPIVQRDIQLTVYDDNFVPDDLVESGWPERWEPSIASDEDTAVGGWLPQKNGWTPDRKERTYQCDASDSEHSWLRYRHFLAVESTRHAPPTPPRPVLVADFCSFNSFTYSDARPFDGSTYWVGDLTVSADVEVTETRANSEMVLELVEGPHIFQAVIDLASGQAELTQRSITQSPFEAKAMASAATSLTGAGSWEVSFANVDDRLCLIIDGDAVEFEGAEYEDSDIPWPTNLDLAPCGVAFRNTTASVSNLLLERDIYYRNDLKAFDEADGVDFDGGNVHAEAGYAVDLRSHLDDPESWARAYQQQSTSHLQNYGGYGDYVLGPDEYLMFGDNSSMSKDSRLFDYFSRPLSGVFSHRYAVRQQDLIGKALYIFWPHGEPFLNGGEGFAIRNHTVEKGYEKTSLEAGEYPSFRAPFYPNVSRMKKIR